MIATLALWLTLTWQPVCPPLGCVVSPNPPFTVPFVYLPLVTK
jgi:hypothetical protein